MDSQTVLIGIGGLVIGFLAGRLSASASRTTVTLSAPAIDGPVAPEILAAIEAGQKIQAVKRYRELYGVDLKQAKDAIDALSARKQNGG